MGKRAGARTAWVIVTLLGLLLAACGGASLSRSAQDDPVRLLVGRGDLGSEWVMDRGTTNGHVPEFEDGYVWGPQPLACDARPADSELTAEWEARRAFEMFDRPADVPSGEEGRMYRVKVEEVLVTGTKSSVGRLYDAFVAGMEACAAVLPGPAYSGDAVAVALPPVGQARAGIDMSFREKRSATPLVGTVRTIVVRQEEVLMLVTLSEDTFAPSRGWRPQRQVDAAALDEILTTMVGHLG